MLIKLPWHEKYKLMRNFYLAAIALFISITYSTTAIAEWSFYAEVGSSTLFLSETASTNPTCKGQREASEQKFALNKWVYLRDLCYTVNKKGNVTFTDPAKLFFASFEVKSEKFRHIPTAAEQQEAEIAKLRAQNDREIAALQRQIGEQQQRRQERIREERNQDGITTMMIDGKLKICTKIGIMLDCN